MAGFASTRRFKNGNTRTYLTSSSKKSASKKVIYSVKSGKKK